MSCVHIPSCIKYILFYTCAMCVMKKVKERVREGERASKISNEMIFWFLCCREVR